MLFDVVVLLLLVIIPLLLVIAILLIEIGAEGKDNACSVLTQDKTLVSFVSKMSMRFKCCAYRTKPDLIEH